MIEEASGTSLYETKREFTTKVIEKKDSKIKEMNSVCLIIVAFNKSYFSLIGIWFVAFVGRDQSADG